MLFAVTKLKDEPAPVTAGGGIVDTVSNVVAPKLKGVIEQVEMGRSVHWVTEGDWSMHHMLNALLQRTGPAEVLISSYACSEMPARMLCDLKVAGTITKLSFIIDSRVDVRSASALTMLRNQCDQLKLLQTHAKVTLIKNSTWWLVVVGSANYTTNRRFEAGFICGDAAVCSFHQKWIQDAISSTD